MARILVVDGDEELRASVETALSRAGYEVDSAGSAGQAYAHLQRASYELVVTEVKLLDVDGFELMRHAKAMLPDVEMLVVTAFGDIPLAVDAIRHGAYDFLTRPFKRVELEYAVSRALEKQALTTENRRLKVELANFVMATGRQVETEHLPDSGHRAAGSDATGTERAVIPVPIGTTLDEVERILIKETLKTTGGNKQKAASLLGIAARTIYRKLDEPHSSASRKDVRNDHP